MLPTLIASLAALAIAPLVFRILGGSRVASAGLDGFVRIGIGGLLFAHVIPEAWAGAGWAALAVFAAGMALPIFLHKWMHGSALAAEVGLGMTGLAVHAFFDGAALTANVGLGAAIVLHRLPVGMAVWWLVRPRFGVSRAVLVLAVMMLATIAGTAVDLSGTGSLLFLFQALMAGALFHVVVGHPHRADSMRSGYESIASAMGGLLALAGVLGLNAHEPHAATTVLHDAQGEIGFASGFWLLAVESAPALLAASITIALSKAFMPESLKGFFKGGTAFTQALRGTAAGLPVPICSCGVIPVYRGLIEAKTPMPAAMSFLVATPELGWASVMLSFGLLGAELTWVRLVGAAILATVMGLTVGRMRQKGRGVPEPVAPSCCGSKTAPQPTAWAKLKAGLRYGFGDIIDDTGPWILLGLAIAALLNPILDSGFLPGLPAGADILVAAFLGMPLYVCASGSTPLIAVLLGLGLSPGAGLAFLLTGPATNVTTFGVLRDLHGKRVAIAFSLLMPLLAVVLGFAVNSYFGGSFQAKPIDAHAHEHTVTWKEWMAFTLAAIYLVSFFRQGVPGFLAKVFRPMGPVGHDSEHGGCCGD
ncbi:MAG: hypothetical protein HOM34_02985 [Planctomycetes bacterium]|jgi:hypothetical protein|nr:hypothetical protein [Planctomycetota bacterium]